MNAAQKHVAVIGAGVTGLAAADLLAVRGVHVALIEKSPFLGGHAVQLSCKATDSCVKCGACVAEDRLMRATRHPDVASLTGTHIESITGAAPFQVNYRTDSPLVNADRCNDCGICFQACPVPGAMLRGRAARGEPSVAIRRELCRYFDHAACTLCRDACPEHAIHLSSSGRNGSVAVDAILVATGFAPYNPSAKPYGYGLFPNVITSLDAERMLRNETILKRPSDGRPVKQLAFIQCVGSRDARLGHPWCSTICCGSSLRMARLIQSRQEDVQVTCFYIDVQTFGRDFSIAYPHMHHHITMIRAVPGEIRLTAADDLEVIYFDPRDHQSREGLFDAVILSVGLLPAADNQHVAAFLGISPTANGFMPAHGDVHNGLPQGIFTAGAALGPMSIAESVGSAEKAVYDMVQYLAVA